ncbi:MAG TPA: hypothetical protein VM100_01625 [Longimicrobiales bacterium]|nr:hypothetical protein [Longimicrobiales bacterium]
MGEVENAESPHERIIRLAFGYDESRYERFVRAIEMFTPANTQVILRGSAVTGFRWADGQPFDGDGPGTSDLDVTFLSKEACDLFEEFYIAGMHTAPLSEDNPGAAPPLVDLRRRLCELAGRPVNLQASTSFVQFARDVLFDQPYYTLIERSDDREDQTS